MRGHQEHDLQTTAEKLFDNSTRWFDFGSRWLFRKLLQEFPRFQSALGFGVNVGDWVPPVPYNGQPFIEYLAAKSATERTFELLTRYFLRSSDIDEVGFARYLIRRLPDGPKQLFNFAEGEFDRCCVRRAPTDEDLRLLFRYVEAISACDQIEVGRIIIGRLDTIDDESPSIPKAGTLFTPFECPSPASRLSLYTTIIHKLGAKSLFVFVNMLSMCEDNRPRRFRAAVDLAIDHRIRYPDSDVRRTGIANCLPEESLNDLKGLRRLMFKNEEILSSVVGSDRVSDLICLLEDKIGSLGEDEADQW